MKTHPQLLVRDALAALFVAASAGDARARADVAALERWCRGGGPPPALYAEDGTPLFDPGAGLAPRFAALEPYLRDRARRFVTACAWIAEGEAWNDPLERARAAWDAGLFFEVHEIAEPEWVAASGSVRELLQGVIQAGAALHHLGEANPAGARGLLGDAARKLASSERDDYDFASFARDLLALREGIERGEVRALDDIAELPRLARRTR